MKTPPTKWRRAPPAGVAAILLIAALAGPAASYGLPQASEEEPANLANAFSEEWRWVRFTTASGLPSNTVVDVIETPAESVWAATMRGLAWFDGYRWHAISATNGFPETKPSAIAAHGADEILAVLDRRLYRGDRTGFREVDIELDGIGYGALEVSSMGANGSIVVATTGRDAPIVSILYEDDRFVRLIDNPEMYWDQDQVRAFGGGNRGFWLSTMNGLSRWNGFDWKTKIGSPINLPLGVEQLAETAEQEGLAAISFPDEVRGIWEWSNGEEPRINAGEPTDLLQSLDISANGSAVVAYRSGDVRVRIGGTWSKLERTPRQMAGLLSVRFRPDGDLWVGTQRGLFLFRASLQRWTHWEVESPNIQNEILDILRTDDGSTWLATSRGVAIHRPDGTVDWVRNIGETELLQITGLAEEASGDVWISSGSALSGAYRFDGDEWHHYGTEEGLLAPFVHRIRKDRAGRLWFLGMAPLSGPRPHADQPGAFLLAGDHFEQWGQEQGLLNGRVYDFVEDPDGNYWFATLGGLSRWGDGGWTHWTTSEGLKRDRVFTLAVDYSGRLWFGDQVSGLGYIDADDRPQYLTTADGLIDDEVWELRLGPGGELWISTRGGLACYHEGNWLSLDVASGLSSPNLWPILPLEGEVLVGTSGKGLDILSLAEMDRPGPRVDGTETFVDDNTALLRWTAVSYWGEVAAENVETRHRLDSGPWSDWSVARETRLTDLSRGPHVVDLQAKGLFGGFDSPGETVAFITPPPLYMQANFYAPVGALTIMVLLLLAGRRRHVALLREGEADDRRRLEVRVAERTEALRESEERLRMLLETTHVIPWESDAETWTFTYVGPQAVRILGYPVERWYEPTFWSDHIHADDVDAAKRFAAEQSAISSQYEFEYRMVAADGETVWIHDLVSVIPQPPEAEPATILRGFMIDITERKRAEEERLVAESEALEHRERLAHIARVNMLGEMATGIAHEVNQPLTAVSTYTQACKRLIEAGTMDQAQLLDVLGRISSEAVRAGDMIHGLKALVRKRDSELRICNVNDLIHDVLPLAEVEARHHGVEIVLDLADGVADVAADRVQIQQVVLNLIRNAIEATEPRGGRVMICTADGDDDMVELEVADNGRGISDADPEKVFQPFFSTKADGMGMGLSISRSIIAAHGGQIGHRPSRLGGCTFYFRLPAERQTAATA